jgi:hypothetical protein
MKVEAFTAARLRKICGLGKWQIKFIIHPVHLYLSMQGRKNYILMARYGI